MNKDALTNNGEPHDCSKVQMNITHKDKPARYCPDCLKIVDTPHSNTDWREEFNEIYDLWNFVRGEGYEDIVEFISQLLEAEKKRWKQEAIDIVTKEIKSTDNGEVLSYLERINHRLGASQGFKKV